MATGVRKANQTQAGLFDKEITDPEIRAAIDELIDVMEEHGEAHSAYVKAQSTYRETLKPFEQMLEDGERLRVSDRRVVTFKARSGGGFEVPAWEKAVPGKISQLA